MFSSGGDKGAKANIVARSISDAARGVTLAPRALKIPRFRGHPNWRENAPGVIHDKKKKKRRPRRVFTPEFKAEAVRLCKVGDRTVTQVAVDLDLTETALRE